MQLLHFNTINKKQNDVWIIRFLCSCYNYILNITYFFFSLKISHPFNALLIDLRNWVNINIGFCFYVPSSILENTSSSLTLETIKFKNRNAMLVGNIHTGMFPPMACVHTWIDMKIIYVTTTPNYVLECVISTLLSNEFKVLIRKVCRNK